MWFRGVLILNPSPSFVLHPALFFSSLGRVNQIWVARNPPGFAFVDMDDLRDAEDAIDGLDGFTLRGARIQGTDFDFPLFSHSFLDNSYLDMVLYGQTELDDAHCTHTNHLCIMLVGVQCASLYFVHKASKFHMFPLNVVNILWHPL